MTNQKKTIKSQSFYQKRISEELKRQSTCRLELMVIDERINSIIEGLFSEDFSDPDIKVALQYALERPLRDKEIFQFIKTRSELCCKSYREQIKREDEDG